MPASSRSRCSDTYAETVTINVVDGTVTQKSGSAIPSEQPPLTFVPSGFRITNGANVGTTIGTQIAGKTSTQSLALQAIRTDTNTGACTAAFASGTTVAINLGFQCNNPAACVAGQTMTVTNNGVTTSIASNPNGGTSELDQRAAEVQHRERRGADRAQLLGCRPGHAARLVQHSAQERRGLRQHDGRCEPVRRAALQLHALEHPLHELMRPAPATPRSARRAIIRPRTRPPEAVFLPAGQPFSATVTASNFAGAATPNYGQEIPAQGVTLAANLVAPAGGDAAALNNPAAFGTFSGGVASGTTFSWPEVGIISLTPSVANYLGSGTVTGAYFRVMSGGSSPTAFAVALNTPVFGTGCAAGNFSYVGQPLIYTVAPVVTVTAQTSGGATTRNYTGAFMRLSNSSLTGRTYSPTPASPALNVSGLPAPVVDPAISDLGTGQATLTFSTGSGLSFNRGAASAPFNANIALSINVIDGDGVSASNPVSFGSGTGISFSTGAAQYYGRLALRDAVGSELLDLPMSLTTQYYLNTTQGFTTNTADSCTVAPAISFSNYQSNLTPGQTCVRDTGRPGLSGLGCAAPAAAGSQYRPTAAAGNFNLILAAPGAGNSGALNVTAAAPSWLQYSWGTTQNPLGMATFGIFPGPTSRVHQREVY